MGDMCGDNRFEVIAKAKEAILQETNISSSPYEMDVLDAILYRCWQMGWLKLYEPIDEEELDRMADEEFPTSVFYNCYGDCVGEDNKRKEKAAFKLGVRKAKGK